MKPLPLAVIGSSNVDLIMQVPHLPAEGETILGGKITRAFGGKGANQAVAAVRAGGDVTFITALGEDPDSAAMQEAFIADGIDLSCVHVTDREDCGTAFITLDATGANTITVASGANGTLSPESIRSFLRCIPTFHVVLLQMEIPFETVQAVLKEARKHKVKTVLNVAPATEKARELLPDVDILIVNETEASILSGLQVTTQTEAVQALEHFTNQGIPVTIITLGSKGLVIGGAEFGEVIHIPAHKVKTVDTTGAGDTFCGSFCTALTEGKSIKDAAEFATKAAALATMKVGAQPAIPCRADIDRL